MSGNSARLSHINTDSSAPADSNWSQYPLSSHIVRATTVAQGAARFISRTVSLPSVQGQAMSTTIIEGVSDCATMAACSFVAASRMVYSATALRSHSTSDLRSVLSDSTSMIDPGLQLSDAFNTEQFPAGSLPRGTLDLPSVPYLRPPFHQLELTKTKGSRMGSVSLFAGLHGYE